MRNIAHFLKILAYAISFAGLCLDYVQIHRDEQAASKQDMQQFLKTVKAIQDFWLEIVELPNAA